MDPSLPGEALRIGAHETQSFTHLLLPKKYMRLIFLLYKRSVAKRGFATLERPPLREKEVHGGKTVGFPSMKYVHVLLA